MQFRHQTIPLLDHGYAKLIKFWGDESEIIESARMSTGGEFVSWAPYEGKPKGDLGLLTYLYNHRHDTPFEFVGMTLEIKAPIMVFREWHRHRTMSYNEASARYIPYPDEKYVPTRARIMRGIEEAGSNHQAGANTDHTLTPEELDTWLGLLVRAYETTEIAYQYGLKHGIPKELARLSMPVGQYSTMRVNTNLRNWLSFMYLRQAPNAQEEIRVYADAVFTLLKQQFPHTLDLYQAGNR